jgi:hypothetical protein
MGDMKNEYQNFSPGNIKDLLEYQSVNMKKEEL